MRSPLKDGMHLKNNTFIYGPALLSALLLATAASFFSCNTVKKSYDPYAKLPPELLQKDYRVFRATLEQYHPGLYWFTGKDSMDRYFNWGYQQLQDSLNEIQFKNILSVVANKIRCGHTTIKNSKAFSRYLNTTRARIFPLSVKVWPDSMAVVANLIRSDSLLGTGTVLTGIDGRSAASLVDTLSNYVNSDGYTQQARYQLLSNLGSFGSLYRSVFGSKDSFSISYKTPEGAIATAVVPAFDTKKDSSRGNVRNDIADKSRLNKTRNLQVDTALSSAYMVLNAFTHGHQLRRFFRSGFRLIQQHQLQHLVIDVRSNGGGDAGLTRVLTSYLAKRPFRIADTLWSHGLKGKDKKYIRFYPFYRTVLFWVTRKKEDGLRHFGYFERHAFQPRKKFHFDGSIYFITGGNSFSATTLLLHQLREQSNVTIVGEETGGGAYGNAAWMIPDVTLPYTRIRYRLPLFRLVMNKEALASGRGILPHVWARATAGSIRFGIDVKTQKVRQLIQSKSSSGTGH